MDSKKDLADFEAAYVLRNEHKIDHATHHQERALSDKLAWRQHQDQMRWLLSGATTIGEELHNSFKEASIAPDSLVGRAVRSLLRYLIVMEWNFGFFLLSNEYFFFTITYI